MCDLFTSGGRPGARARGRPHAAYDRLPYGPVPYGYVACDHAPAGARPVAAPAPRRPRRPRVRVH